ncbi:MAG: glycine cleavage system aminomethyltransferase T, partial [Gammaproteobacteria bacterium]
GKSHGMQFSSAESMGIRRIEAGILDYGTDIDMQMTPYQAGLGAFVDLSKDDFVGKSALLDADQSIALFGLKCRGAAPLSGLGVWEAGNRVGTMTTGAWTPYLNTGIGFVRFDAAGDWLGRSLTLVDRDNNEHACEVVELPFYDSKKEIPRGVAVATDID